MRSAAPEQYFLKGDGITYLMTWIGDRRKDDGSLDLWGIAKEAGIDYNVLTRITKPDEPAYNAMPALVALAKRYGADPDQAAAAMFELRPVEPLVRKPRKPKVAA